MNLDIPELIHTSRLALKRPIESYAQAMFDAYASDAAVTKYLSWPAHKEVTETATFLHSLDQRWNQQTGFSWSIFNKGEDRLIGMIDLRIELHRAECGYVIARPDWGNGYTTEALIAVRDLAFSIPQVERFQIVCDVDNPASAKVMEKAGFEKEGILRRYFFHPNVSDRPRDCLCYSFIRP